MLVSAAGYAIVGLFAAAFGVTSLLWPKLSTSTNTVIAALVAAPAALALIWPRLTTVKALGVEVSLAEAAAEAVEPGLIEAVMVAMSPDPGAMKAFVAELTKAETSVAFTPLASPIGDQLEQMRKTATGMLIPIDLGGGDRWLSTRLYLVAALADDFMRVPQFVFTTRYPQDAFVGMAGPSALKMALGLALPPAVDEAYVTARREAADLALDHRLLHVATRFAELVSQIEWPDRPTSAHSGVPWVTGDGLYAWLTAAGKEFDTEAIVVTGLSHEQLVLAVALDTHHRHIALVAATRRLLIVVDRLEILAQAAEARHRPHLWTTRPASDSARSEA